MTRKGAIGLVALLAVVFLGLVVYLADPFRFFVVKSPQPASTPAAQVKSVDKQPAVVANVHLNNLEKYLTVEGALLGATDSFSLYFKDINTGITVGIDPVKSWIPASTIKAFVILEAFRQRRQGLISFDAPVTITAQNVVPTELESDDYPRLREGVQATVGQLVEAMIVQSDNTAYNTLLDVLDRRNVNGFLRQYGITETIVGEKLNLDGTQLAQDLTVVGRQPNTTSAKDLATLFDLLSSDQIPDSDQMLAIFKKQKINNMIPVYLPQDTTVAHKTGDWAPIYHDGGVVYKTASPFIFVVFTSNNNPDVVAKLAQIAYFQNATVVGSLLNGQETSTRAEESEGGKVFTADAANTRVLGEKTNLPTLTAADFGITSDDLNPAARAKKVRAALVAPDSVFYPLKRLLENVEFKLERKNRSEKSLAQTKNRLSELKSALSSGKIDEGRAILDESSTLLKNSVETSSSEKDRELVLSEIKRVDDLHFATLAEVATKIEATKKEQFVDLVYDFYLKNSREIKPQIKNALVSQSTDQVPTIGIVKSVDGGRVTLALDDGSTKEVIVGDNTPGRVFGSNQLQTGFAVSRGLKVAVVGQFDKDGRLIASFVMKGVPKNLPERHVGQVLEIDTGKGKMRILNAEGKKEELTVDPSTVIKGKDTNVSLGGIKAGSEIAAFSETRDDNNSSTGEPPKATSVTIVTNSSGKNEKARETKPQKSGGSKSAPREEKRSEPPKQQPEQKKQEDKKK